MEMTVSKERFQKISEVIENFDGEEISFSFLIGSLFQMLGRISNKL